jgi:hypothetical protein
MVGYSFLDDSFIRNSMPVHPGANQPCRLLQCKAIFDQFDIAAPPA